MPNTKKRIIQAAAALFSEQGFKETTIRDICRKANVNVAAVNYHFHGKEELFKAIIESIFEKRSQQQKKLFIDRQVTNEDEWQDLIYTFISDFIHESPEGECVEHNLSKLFFRELGNPSAFFREMHEKYLTPIEEKLKSYLRMGLPADTPEEKVALWVTTIISQCGFFRNRQGLARNITQLDFSKPENQKLVADHIAETIFATIKFNREN